MKSRMIKIMWLCLGLATLQSCSKEQDCDENDLTSECYTGLNPGGELLLTDEVVNGETELSFEYDEQNRVSVYHVYPRDGSNEAIMRYSYNVQGQTASVDYYSGNHRVMREEYVYGANGRPTSGVQILAHEKQIIQYSYADGTQNERYVAPDGTVTGLNTYSFDEQGNIRQITIGIGGIWQSTQEFDNYDDKRFRFTAYPWSWKSAAVNNARSFKLTNAVGLVIDQDWKFTYNEQGYPIKAHIYNKGSNTVVETREYHYQKAK